MSSIEKQEQDPAPIMTPSFDFKEYSDCLYICFSIDKSIYDKNGITVINNFASNLSSETHKLSDNLVVVCIYSEGFINNVLKMIKLKNTHSCRISYKFKKETIFNSDYDFVIKQNTIKFLYNAQKKVMFP